METKLDLEKARKVINEIANTPKITVDVYDKSQDELKDTITNSFDKNSIYTTYEILEKAIKDKLISRPIIDKMTGKFIIKVNNSIHTEENSALQLVIDILKSHGTTEIVYE